MPNCQSIIDQLFSLHNPDIEIQRARTPLHDSHSPRCALDSLQRAKKLRRSELRLDGDHLVQVSALRNGPQRSGLFNNALTDDSHLFQLRNRAARTSEVGGAIAEVRSQG